MHKVLGSVPSNTETKPVIPALRSRGQMIRSSKSLSCYIESLKPTWATWEEVAGREGEGCFPELSRSTLFPSFLSSPPSLPAFSCPSPFPSCPPLHYFSFLFILGFFLHHLKYTDQEHTLCRDCNVPMAESMLSAETAMSQMHTRRFL